MRELSLFSGAGGGLWGSRLLGWETIGYVEKDKYCQQVIAQRIKDGWFHEAPIFGDINAFLDQGYAERYRGMVDIITAGFPCQGFSIAGKQRGKSDQRNQWPATIECIRQIRPRYILLENSPELVRFDYYGEILGNLADIGFDAEWHPISAWEAGAEHLRRRWWLIGVDTNAMCSGCGKLEVFSKPSNEAKRQIRNDNQLPDDTRPNATRNGCHEIKISSVGTKERFSSWSRDANSIREAWRLCEPGVVGMANDVAHRCNRIRAAGNGQVSLAMVRAVETLSRRIISGGGLK